MLLAWLLNQPESNGLLQRLLLQAMSGEWPPAAGAEGEVRLLSLVMPVGRHKGQPISRLPRGYLQQVQNRAEIAPGVRAAIAAELKRREALTDEIITEIATAQRWWDGWPHKRKEGE
jgi:Asp-tRNA(Asn)/Glu-tRNA(Gln) amidotransferase A subunit family amidase